MIECMVKKIVMAKRSRRGRTRMICMNDVFGTMVPGRETRRALEVEREGREST